jgi:hypothetical protein
MGSVYPHKEKSSYVHVLSQVLSGRRSYEMKTVHRPLLVLLFVASLAFLLEGQATSPTSAAPATPNKLEIARTPGLNNSGESSDEVVSRAQLVQKLYTHTLSLPAASSNQLCPMYLIANYHLTFYHDHVPVLNVNAVDGECHSVKLSNGDVRTADSTFWRLLDQAQAVGLGQSVKLKSSFAAGKSKLRY